MPFEDAHLNVIDVAPVSLADAPVRAPPFLDRQGVFLAWGSFVALCLSTAAILSILAFLPPDGGLQVAALTDLKHCFNVANSTMPCTSTEVAQYKALLNDPAVDTFREFWKSVLERVSIGIFFPILTGLLGYLFGSRTRDSED